MYMQTRNRLKKYKTSLWLPTQRRNGGGTNFFYENNKLLCMKQKSNKNMSYINI